MTGESKYLAVGHVKDAQGIKGEIYVRLFAGQADWLDKLKDIRLKNRDSGEIKTYQIAKIRRHKEGLVVLLNGILDRNQAETLKTYTFEIPEEFLKSKPGEAIYLFEILGFTVIDQRLGKIGEVKSFSSNGPQDLLEVETNQGEGHKVEVLIPFIAAFIIKIDYEKRIINMNLPEGLCDSM